MINEKYLEKKLTEGLHALGVWCEKYTNPFKTGYPDRICIEKTGKVSWVEVKTPGEKLRPLQEERKRELEGYGCPVYVVDSEDALRSVLEHFAPVGSTCIIETNPDEIKTVTIAGVQRRFEEWETHRLYSECDLGDGAYLEAEVSFDMNAEDDKCYATNIYLERYDDDNRLTDRKQLKHAAFSNIWDAVLYCEMTDLGEIITEK